MVRITQTSSTILIAMLLNCWWGLCSLFLFYRLNTRHGRGLTRQLFQRAAGGPPPSLLGSFLSSPVSWISECGSGDNYCSTGRQPANWRSDAGYLPQSWRTTTGVVRPNLWRNFTCGWRLVGSQTLILIRGWCRLWLTVRGALPYLLYACDRDEQ